VSRALGISVEQVVQLWGEAKDKGAQPKGKHEEDNGNFTIIMLSFRFCPSRHTLLIKHQIRLEASKFTANPPAKSGKVRETAEPSGASQPRFT
jgi:hypothetical protein